MEIRIKIHTVLTSKEEEQHAYDSLTAKLLQNIHSPASSGESTVEVVLTRMWPKLFSQTAIGVAFRWVLLSTNQFAPTHHKFVGVNKSVNG